MILITVGFLIIILGVFLGKKNPDSINGDLIATIGTVFLFMILCIFVLEYVEYIESKATVFYCKETVDEKTLELNETVNINKTDEVYQKKFSKNATQARTQEYLKNIQNSRLREREKCLEAKRDVLRFKLGLFGIAS